jgi:hypothetical protein
MKSALFIIANRITVCFQQTVTQVDLEVLQWPDGSFIALMLLVRRVATAAFHLGRADDV